MPWLSGRCREAENQLFAYSQRITSAANSNVTIRRLAGLSDSLPLFAPGFVGTNIFDGLMRIPRRGQHQRRDRVIRLAGRKLRLGKPASRVPAIDECIVRAGAANLYLNCAIHS